MFTEPVFPEVVTYLSTDKIRRCSTLEIVQELMFEYDVELSLV